MNKNDAAMGCGLVVAIIGGFIGLFILGWLLVFATFGIRVATAGIVGKGEAHIQKESASNRIASQARFATDLTSIVKFNQQYNDSLKAVAQWDEDNKGKPDNAIGTLATQRQNLVLTSTGIQQQCQNTIQDYDRAGSSYLSEDFKSAGFPDVVSIHEFCQGKPVKEYPGIAQ